MGQFADIKEQKQQQKRALNELFYNRTMNKLSVLQPNDEQTISVEIVNQAAPTEAHMRSSPVWQTLAQFSAESRPAHVTVAITAQQTRFAHEKL